MRSIRLRPRVSVSVGRPRPDGEPVRRAPVPPSRRPAGFPEPEPTPVIETRDIRVDYGDFTAVRDLAMSIEPGEIHGLVGPNGAGKTSLIRVLATLREPTYGEARIAGLDTVADRAEVRRRIGYMPDLAPVHEELTCREVLEHFAAAYHLPRPARRRRVDACLELVSLSGKRDAMAGTLSRGMTQRLVLAKTILHDPAVLLLDEPASGLDPIARRELRTLLVRLAEGGRTIVISSHILDELAAFCTSIGIMSRGELVVHGAIDEVTAALNVVRRHAVRVLATEDLGRADSRLALRDDVSDVEADPVRGELRFALAGDEAATAAVLAELVAAGVRVVAFEERRRGVEDVMLEIGATEAS